MAADLHRCSDWLDFLRALPARAPALRVDVVNGSAVTGGFDEDEAPARLSGRSAG